MKTNLAYIKMEENKKEVPWNYLCEEISKVFRLSRKEKRSL